MIHEWLNNIIGAILIASVITSLLLTAYVILGKH